MSNSLMSLGMFVFGMGTTAYDNLRRQLAWRHPANSRVGVRPARQFLGPDDETINLAGTVHHDLFANGAVSLDQIEAMGNKGEAYLLVGGDGSILGEFVIESLETTHTYFFPDGTARKIEFSLKLTRVDDATGKLVGDDE